jgi:UDP-glucose 4-epimerase
MPRRRPGEPAALVAGAGRIAGRIYDVLGSESRLDNLDTIVEGALSWEKHLQESRAGS